MCTPGSYCGSFVRCGVDGSHRVRYEEHMAKKPASRSARPRAAKDRAARPGRRPSALLDTRIIYCGDCLDRLARLPDACVELARELKKTGSFYYHCGWHHRHGNGRPTLETD